LTTLVASALPHLLKTAFDQKRPDRNTVRGHWRGVPLSIRACLLAEERVWRSHRADEL
jgi:hypothetical protein